MGVSVTRQPKLLPASRRTATWGAGLRIMVVDDDEDTRAGLRIAIEVGLPGVHVTELGTAADACRRLPTERFDLVIADVRMEDDTAGWRVAELAQRSGVAVLLLSGHESSADAGTLRDVPLVSKSEILRRNVVELIECVLTTQQTSTAPKRP